MIKQNFRILIQYRLNVSKLVTLVEGDPKAPFSIATTLRCRGRCYSIPWFAPLYTWFLPYKSVKQGAIKYYFFSLWYDSTWDWTQVSQPIGEHYSFE